VHQVHQDLMLLDLLLLYYLHRTQNLRLYVQRLPYLSERALSQRLHDGVIGEDVVGLFEALEVLEREDATGGDGVRSVLSVYVGLLGVVVPSPIAVRTTF